MSTTTTVVEEKQYTRSSTNLNPKWDRFFPKTTSNDTTKSSSKLNGNKKDNNNNTCTPCFYNSQYSLMYTSRLEQLRKRIVIPKSEDNIKHVSRIIGLQDDECKCIVVGTIVKQYNKLPKDLENSGVLPLVTTTFTDPEHDLIVLEDESGRIEIDVTTNSNVLKESNVLSTGVVVGVQGYVQSIVGRFKVEKFLYPTLPPPPSPTATLSNKNNRVALISGLQIGSNDENNNESNSLRRALLIDYLSGNISGTASFSSTISHLILAGGNISTTTTNNKKNCNTSYAIHELDLFLSEVCANGIPTEIIPGKHDPTNANFPYRNFHPCLFPIVTKYYSNYIKFSCNPFDADIGNRCFLGTDGSNILNFMHYTSDVSSNNDDVKKEKDDYDNDDVKNEKYEEKSYSSISPLQALEYTLRYNLIAPTAPDTIPSFPFNDTNYYDVGDPLVMQYNPHVYFIGNCMEFQTKKVDECCCRLICIPDFSKTGQIVLLDLDTLDCEVVQIIETLEDEEDV